MSDFRAELLSRIAILWRRRWLALMVCWGLCVIGWGGVLLLPDQYQSQAMVYVDTDTLLGPLLKNLTVENDVQHQVPLITRTLLSRSNLHKVAVATDLALAVQTPVDEVNLFEHMLRHAQISVQGVNLLAISYTDPNPTLARDVVQALLSVLVDNSDVQNRAEMEKALGFIERQIASYEEKLRVIEQHMAEFKRQHGDVLLSSSANLGARKDSLREAVSTAQGQVAELKSAGDLLMQQLKTVPQFLSVDNAPPVVVTGSHAETGASTIAELQKSLDELRLHYTDKHPDVIAVKRQLAELEARAGAEPGEDAGEPRYRSQVSNPVFEQLQMRLFEAQQQMSLARGHLAAAQSAQTDLEVQAAENPSMVAEYTDLTREYDVLKKQYDELLVRRESALMSQAVENSSQKIQFRVVDPPRIAAKPSGPHRLAFLAAVLAGSLAAGLGTALLLDHLEAPVTSPDILVRRSGLPVLGVITFQRKAEDEVRARRGNVRFGIVSVCLVLIFCVLFLATLRSSGILAGVGRSDADRMITHVG